MTTKAIYSLLLRSVHLVARLTTQRVITIG